MMRYLHYLLVPVFYLAVALAGSFFTARGVETWYIGLLKPEYTPPGFLIGIIWTAIYILTAMSLIMFINRGRNYPLFWMIIGLYIFNGIINALWSYIFFTGHMIGLAIVNAAAIAASVCAIMILIGRSNLPAALLLLPYLLWSTFAVGLTCHIYGLNRSL